MLRHLSSSRERHPQAAGSDAGFSLTELLVSMILVLIVFGGVITALNKLSQSQRSIWNRTEMHSGVRGATELLQQEVGQAGRISLPAPVTLQSNTDTMASENPVVLTVTLSSTDGMFVGEQLVIDTGTKLETVTVTALDLAADTITGSFVGLMTHSVGAVVMAQGGFATGIVAPGTTNGSTDTLLKLYGDINADGTMVYVEYTCDTVSGNLYRNVMPWNATSKPAVTTAQVLLANIVANPGGTPCFTYQTAVVETNTYVLDVAITLTVRTQLVDPVTKLFQTETKALLNVAPRNILNTWQLASIGLSNRIQPMPPSIAVLLQ